MRKFDETAAELLRATSRTFFVPIMRLPGDLRQAVASGYLCMRAIDEIEDHPAMAPEDKAGLLEQIAEILQSARTASHLDALGGLFVPYEGVLPRVTRLLAEHACLAPDSVVRLVWRSTADMAVQMAYWVRQGWRILNEADLDDYTFDVAGRVGLMLNALWRWHDNTTADEELAIGFGRGLQSVNILRNHAEDARRGVNYFPHRWTPADMERYSRRQLGMGAAYLAQLPQGPALEFCRIPLHLAQATLDALGNGEPKLTREKVMELIAACSRSRASERESA